jgi:transcriptional regulator
MYTPKKFQQHDVTALKELIVAYPFATLMTHSDAGIEAEHIPFILTQVKGRDVLQGHIAKANPLWKKVKDNAQVLIVFNGPNCYISPNYYPTKKEAGKVVPTWNYVTVHVKGAISFVQDDNWNFNLITNLTNHHEAAQQEPWSIEDAPQEYIARMLPAIVGIEIDITSITGKWKVSQNQPEINKQGMVNALSKEVECDARKIAKLVQTHMEEMTE